MAGSQSEAAIEPKAGVYLELRVHCTDTFSHSHAGHKSSLKTKMQLTLEVNHVHIRPIFQNFIF